MCRIYEPDTLGTIFNDLLQLMYYVCNLFYNYISLIENEFISKNVYDMDINNNANAVHRK